MGLKDFLKSAASKAGKVAQRVAASETAQRVAASLAASAFSATNKDTDPGARAVFLRAIAAGFDKTAEPVDLFSRNIFEDLQRVSKEELNQKTYQKILEKHLEQEKRSSENYYAHLQDEIKHVLDYEKKEGVILDKFMKRADDQVRLFDAKLEKAHQALVGVGKKENADAKALRDAIMLEAENVSRLSQNDGLHYEEELALLGAEAGYEAIASGFSSIPLIGGPLSMAAHAAGKLMEISLNEGFKAKRKNILPLSFNPHDFQAGERISDFAKVVDKNYFTEDEKKQQIALHMLDVYREEIDQWKDKYQRYNEKRQKNVEPAMATREAQHHVEVYDIIENDGVIFLCYIDGFVFEKIVVLDCVSFYQGTLRELFRDYTCKYVQSLPSDVSPVEFKRAIGSVRNFPKNVEPATLRKVVLSILVHGCPSATKLGPEPEISNGLHV